LQESTEENFTGQYAKENAYPTNTDVKQHREESHNERSIHDTVADSTEERFEDYYEKKLRENETQRNAVA